MRRYTTLWITNVVNRRCRSLAEMWATRDLAYDRQQPWKENQVKSGTILAPPGLGGGIPPGYMPRINTGLGFIDLNPRLEKYHTSVYSAIFKSRLSPLANNWNSCKRFCFNILFFAASEAILLIFQCVNVNGIVSLNPMKRHKSATFLSSFSQFFSRALFKHFKPRSTWK